MIKFKGEKIKSFRVRNGFSPRDLELEVYKKTGVKISRTSILGYEEGRVMPSFDKAVALSLVMEEEVGSLFHKNIHYLNNV